jgi:predicted Zn-dependent peptidase
MKLSLESTDDVANFYGMQELMRRDIKTLDDKIKAIMKVTPADIQKMAQTIFKNKNLNLALIGPYKESSKFQNILKF